MASKTIPIDRKRNKIPAAPSKKLQSKVKKQTKKDEAAALALLQDPKFLFLLCQRIGEAGVVGEFANRLIVFLACLTCALKEVVSILLKGKSSSGKNWLAKGVLLLIPPERLFTRTSFSEKALAHGTEDLEGKVLYLVEHRAGRDAQLFTRMLQSEKQLNHEVTVGRRTEVKSRVGAPVFLSTTTDTTVYEDDETRFLSLRADESAQLTREILRTQFSGKHRNEAAVDLSVWHQVYRLLVADVPQFTYPEWLSFVAEVIPADNSRSRRDGPRFLSLLQAIALCQSFSDGRRKHSRSTIEITFADFCVAHGILNESFSSTYTGVHPRALEFAQAVRDLHKETKRPVMTRDVSKRLGWRTDKDSDALAHKWRLIAIREKLVCYDGGTYPNNKKPLIPGPTQQATVFLPDPSLVFNERQDIPDTKFIDPLSGEEKVFRREPKRAARK